MICIGGCCVPTTAVVPVVLLVIRWTLAKLYVWGLVPEFVADLLNLKQINLASSSKQQQEQDKQQCCRRSASTTTDSTVSSSSSTSSTATSYIVKELESEEEFEKLVSKDSNIVCMKFTASKYTQPLLFRPRFYSFSLSKQ